MTFQVYAFEDAADVDEPRFMMKSPFISQLASLFKPQIGVLFDGGLSKGSKRLSYLKRLCEKLSHEM